MTILEGYLVFLNLWTLFAGICACHSLRSQRDDARAALAKVKS
jgi:hypothetical protein